MILNISDNVKYKSYEIGYSIINLNKFGKKRETTLLIARRWEVEMGVSRNAALLDITTFIDEVQATVSFTQTTGNCSSTRPLLDAFIR